MTRIDIHAKVLGNIFLNYSFTRQSSEDFSIDLDNI